MIKNSNLALLAIWFLVWFVIVFRNFAISGLWFPVPDPRSPALVLLSLLFYAPPLIVIASEILERGSGERETHTVKALAVASKSLVVVFGLCALVIVGYAVATL